jgi:hypothetical protein
MYRNCALRTFVIALAVLVNSGFALAAAAAQEMEVRYNIREVPDDPESAITWTIDLSLQAEEIDGNSIAWSVHSVTICQLDAQEQPESTWVDTSPTVDLPGGQWWVTHADAEDPLVSEFVLPPYIEGIAAMENSASADMSYYLEGAPYDPSPDPPLFAVTAALDYSFSVDGDPPVFKEAVAEPVLIPPDCHPPIG